MIDTIAIDPSPGGIIRNPTPELSARIWREGLWCPARLPGRNELEAFVLVGWDGSILAAYDTADESEAGYWRAEP